MVWVGPDWPNMVLRSEFIEVKVLSRESRRLPYADNSCLETCCEADDVGVEDTSIKGVTGMLIEGIEELATGFLMEASMDVIRASWLSIRLTRAV